MVSVVRLVAIPADLDPLARVSTYLLMTSLAGWVLASRGPVLVAIALLFSAGGDVLPDGRRAAGADHPGQVPLTPDHAEGP